MADLSTIVAAPLSQLWVCPDCSAAFNRPQCPYCTTTNVAPLGAWLNREPTGLERMKA